MIVIQLSDKRTGSTFFQRALDSHPNIRAIDELFIIEFDKEKVNNKSGFKPYKIAKEERNKENEKTAKNKGYSGKRKKRFIQSHTLTPQKYISEVYNSILKNEKDVKVVVFKIMYNQLLHWKLQNLIYKHKIIHLYRENHVKRVISGQTASNINHEKAHRLTAKNLINYVKKSIKTQTQFFTLLQKSECKHFEFTTLFGKRIKENKEVQTKERTHLISSNNTLMNPKIKKEVCNFLKLHPFPMYANTIKKNKEDVWVYLPEKEETIEAFEENELNLDWLGDF